ncbi:hypothetical protein HYT25_01885 [Candidatus Pacearchaeota archaeon]|nr:hypothetical protein [Candidatus Pacearchaeota archaeon]
MTKPTEIAKEMGKDGLDVSKKVGKFGYNLAQNVVEHGFTPFIVPTWYRRAINKKYNKFGWSNQQNYGLIRVIEGIYVSGAWSIALVLANVNNIEDRLEYLAIPLATNLASGIYEWGRNAYKRVEEREKIYSR